MAIFGLKNGDNPLFLVNSLLKSAKNNYERATRKDCMNINMSDSAYRVHSLKTESEQDNFLEGLDRKDPEEIVISAGVSYAGLSFGKPDEWLGHQQQDIWGWVKGY